MDTAGASRKEEKTMNKKTTKDNKTICGVCGGEVSKTTITHEEQRGTALYLFQNVLVTVCGACGEIWIDEEVLQEIDRLIKEGVPVRKVETPVYDFSRALPAV